MKKVSKYVFLALLFSLLSFPLVAKEGHKKEKEAGVEESKCQCQKSGECSKDKGHHKGNTEKEGHHKGNMEKGEKPDGNLIGFDEKQKEGSEAICPVTKEKFKIQADTSYTTYKGKYYYFCCDGCKPKFEKDPEKYINK